MKTITLFVSPCFREVLWQFLTYSWINLDLFCLFFFFKDEKRALFDMVSGGDLTQQPHLSRPLSESSPSVTVYSFHKDVTSLTSTSGMQQRGFVGALAGACTSDGQAIMVGQPVRLLGEAGRREFLVVNLLVLGRGGAEAALMRCKRSKGLVAGLDLPVVALLLNTEAAAMCATDASSEAVAATFELKMLNDVFVFYDNDIMRDRRFSRKEMAASAALRCGHWLTAIRELHHIVVLELAPETESQFLPPFEIFLADSALPGRSVFFFFYSFFYILLLCFDFFGLFLVSFITTSSNIFFLLCNCYNIYYILIFFFFFFFCFFAAHLLTVQILIIH